MKRSKAAKVNANVPSPQEVERGKTKRGGYSKKQLAEWGVAWPPTAGWKLDLTRRYADQCDAHFRLHLEGNPDALKRYRELREALQEAEALAAQAHALVALQTDELRSLMLNHGNRKNA